MRGDWKDAGVATALSVTEGASALSMAREPAAACGALKLPLCVNQKRTGAPSDARILDFAVARGARCSRWRRNISSIGLKRSETMRWRRTLLGAVLPVLTVLAATAMTGGASWGAEKVRFNLNWLPEGEHCGFFQAKAAGLYDQAGLDVELKSGGPDINVPLLVANGTVDLGMGTSFTTLNMVDQGIPGVTVAAYFQKDPNTLVAHPGQGVTKLSDVKGRPVMIAKFAQQEVWQFLKQKYGFTDDQLRPYTYSAAPFLADPKAIQQGYVTEDAFLLGAQMPEPPVILFLADYGYQNYATTVFGLRSYIDKNAKTVRAFLDATAKGYAACLAGNYSEGMKMVLALNPEHGEPLFHFKLKQMKERGMVDGDDAAKLGIGAMTDARWKDFFDTMSAAGVYKPSLDYKAAYTLDLQKK
jgi:NitT/TauT family transport system substrate-binding protein